MSFETTESSWDTLSTFMNVALLQFNYLLQCMEFVNVTRGNYNVRARVKGGFHRIKDCKQSHHKQFVLQECIFSNRSRISSNGMNWQSRGTIETSTNRKERKVRPWTNLDCIVLHSYFLLSNGDSLWGKLRVAAALCLLNPHSCLGNEAPILITPTPEERSTKPWHINYNELKRVLTNCCASVLQLQAFLWSTVIDCICCLLIYRNQEVSTNFPF